MQGPWAEKDEADNSSYYLHQSISANSNNESGGGSSSSRSQQGCSARRMIVICALLTSSGRLFINTPPVRLVVTRQRTIASCCTRSSANLSVRSCSRITADRDFQNPRTRRLVGCNCDYFCCRVAYYVRENVYRTKYAGLYVYFRVLWRQRHPALLETSFRELTTVAGV